MPSNYNGIPANISGAFPAALTISTTSGANPMVVQTTTPHGLSSGDEVDIQGITSIDGRNGIWPVTVTGANTFTIPFNGGGFTTSGTGTAQPIKLGVGVYSIPSDGDLDNEASIDNWAKLATGDRTAYLGASLGASKLVQRTTIALPGSVPVLTLWADIAVSNLNIGTLYQLTTSGAFSWLTRGPITSTPVSGGPPTFVIPGISAGDEIEMKIDFNASSDNAAYVAWYFSIQPPGVGAPVFPSVYVQATAAHPIVHDGDPTNITLTKRGAMHFLGSGLATGFSNGNSGNLWLQPIVKPSITGSQSISLFTDFTAVIEVWRATGMPQ